MLRKSGINVPQYPEAFIQGGINVDKLGLPDTVIYSKWKHVTLENNKKKMKIISE